MEDLDKETWQESTIVQKIKPSFPVYPKTYYEILGGRIHGNSLPDQIKKQYNKRLKSLTDRINKVQWSPCPFYQIQEFKINTIKKIYFMLCNETSKNEYDELLNKIYNEFNDFLVSEVYDLLEAFNTLLADNNPNHLSALSKKIRIIDQRFTAEAGYDKIDAYRELVLFNLFHLKKQYIEWLYTNKLEKIAFLKTNSLGFMNYKSVNKIRRQLQQKANQFKANQSQWIKNLAHRDILDERGWIEYSDFFKYWCQKSYNKKTDFPLDYSFSRLLNIPLFLKSPHLNQYSNKYSLNENTPLETCEDTFTFLHKSPKYPNNHPIGKIQENLFSHLSKFSLEHCTKRKNRSLFGIGSSLIGLAGCAYSFFTSESPTIKKVNAACGLGCLGLLGFSTYKTKKIFDDHAWLKQSDYFQQLASFSNTWLQRESTKN